MNHGDKPALKQQEKQKMLDELESLSRLLDEELDDELDEPSRPIPEDIPVLKSFVDDVPVLNERFEEELTPVPAPVQKSDSLDKDAGQFRTLPNTRSSGQLDVSFLDKDPLEISAAVRHHKPATDPNESALDAVAAVQAPARNVEARKPVVSQATRPAPSAEQTPARHQVTPAPRAEPSAHAQPRPAQKVPMPTAPPQAAPIPPSVSATFMPGAASTPKPAPVAPSANSAAGQPMTAASVTQPLSRFQTTGKSENPFLPKSTLDKIRENHANDASSELRKLIENNPLQKLTFDLAPNSKEFQALRQKASQMVNEVIRANMPRLEAELRLKLEQEVDRMFKELKKK